MSFDSILYRISYTNEKDIEKCSARSQKKRQWIGISLLSACTLAGISMCFFLNTALDILWISILGGMIWSFLILTFDRGLFLVKNNFAGKIASVVRIIMIFFIALLVSLPMELELLKGRIDVFLKEKNNLRNNPESSKKEIALSKIQNRQKTLETAMAEKRQSIENYRQEMVDESSGNNGKPRGEGKAYNTAKSAMMSATSELKMLDRQYAEFLRDKARDINKIEGEYASSEFVITTDPLSRYEALLELKGASDSKYTRKATTMLSWLLRILFMFFELLPAFIKLLLTEDDYDTFVLAEEYLSREAIVKDSQVKKNQISISQYKHVNKYFAKI